MAKGRTRWFPRSVAPARKGLYECEGFLAGGFRIRCFLEWDGVGFLTDVPFVVLKWRGMTENAYTAATAKHKGETYERTF